MSTVAGGRAVLRALLESATGSVEHQVEQALALLVEALGMDVAFVSRFLDGQRVVIHSVGRPDVDRVPVGMSHPVGSTLCHLFVTGEAGPLLGDVARDAVVASHPHTELFGVGAYGGVPLVVDGRIVGAVCCGAAGAVRLVHERDVATLREVAAHVGRLLSRQPPAAPVDGLERLAGALADAGDLEMLTRPVLRLLREATGLDSTYLTMVDWAGDTQRIRYAHNTEELHIPEGLDVEWSDTLCRRSLEDGRAVTSDVPSVWRDSRAAAALGIRTYVSVPVVDATSAVVGTLCGASGTSVEVDPRHVATMQLCATLIGQKIAAEAAAAAHVDRTRRLEERLREADELAHRDPLTGLRNRGGIERWLEAVLPALGTGPEQLAVAFCDLDRFKSVNDTLGHGAGDAVLREYARALGAASRAQDLCGRLGGDEFVVAALLPDTPASFGSWAARLRAASRCRAGAVEVVGSVGVARFDRPVAVTDVLAQVDAAMYRDKAGRRQVTSPDTVRLASG